MTNRKSSIKEIVELRTSDTNSISFKTMDFEDEQSLMISVESSGESSSFFFDSAHELKVFARRVMEQAEIFEQ